MASSINPCLDRALGPWVYEFEELGFWRSPDVPWKVTWAGAQVAPTLLFLGLVC